MTQPTSHTAEIVPPWLRILWHAQWPWLALVIALFCLPLFVGFDRTDVENDEAGYSYGVEKMLQNGDWLNPRGIYDLETPFLEKPPLKFWIVYFPIKWHLLPASQVGLRFWDAVMGSLAFLYVFAIGRRLAGPLCGAVAVLVLFTNHQLIFNHGLRTNNMEAALLLQYAGTMYHYLAWRSAKDAARGHLMAIALYFVLGFMTKFVAAVFAPLVVVIVAVFSADDRRRFWRQRLTMAAASVLALVLILPWFVYQYRLVGERLPSLMFGEHVVQRFTGALDPMHLQPWHFYLTESWSQLQIPMQLMLVAGVGLLLARVIRHRWIDGAVILIWFVVPVSLISTGTSKLPHYLYPFLPPVALACGYATAALARWVWRQLEIPAAVIARALDRVRPAVLGRPSPRGILVGTGVAALAIALVTYLAGSLRLSLGPVTLRNSSVLRPLVVAGAALLGGASATALRVILAMLIVLAALPLKAYHATVEEITRTNRPLTELRDCLINIVKTNEAKGQEPPGMWVEAKGMTHQFPYYFRDLGPWQVRSVASDVTVAMHLFAPVTHRPVMLSQERFAGFWAAMKTDQNRILASAAKRAPMDLDVLVALNQDAPLGLVDFGTEKLLLPGPFAACAPRSLPPLVHR